MVGPVNRWTWPTVLEAHGKRIRWLLKTGPINPLLDWWVHWHQLLFLIIFDPSKFEIIQTLHKYLKLVQDSKRDKKKNTKYRLWQDKWIKTTIKHGRKTPKTQHIKQLSGLRIELCSTLIKFYLLIIKRYMYIFCIYWWSMLF